MLSQGREYSWASGLYNFRARWYDPITGRWLSNDPIGISGGLNQYVFCNNNPVNFRDPTGLITIVLPGVGPQTDQGGNSSNEDFIRGVLSRDSSAQVFSRFNMDDAINAVQNAYADGDKCVKIYGYSRGGVAAVELAEALDKLGIPVNYLFTLDPVRFGGGAPLNVPSNVRISENHYQRGTREGITDFPGTPLTGGGGGMINMIYSGVVNGYPVRHENMPAIVLP